MNQRRKRFRANEPTHKELIAKGYSLTLVPKKKQGKDCITSVRWGKNGRRYFKVMKMTKLEKKVFTTAHKLEKAGKEIWFTYKPNSLMLDFIFKYNLDVKKDKRGNVTVTISKATKGKKIKKRSKR